MVYKAQRVQRGIKVIKGTSGQRVELGPRGQLGHLVLKVYKVSKVLLGRRVMKGHRGRRG